MAAALLQLTCTYRGMLAVRATGIRPLIPALVPDHFRAFSLRKEPDLEDNPYYNKYQDKIQKMRNCKPQEFQARMETRHRSKKEVLGHSEQADFIRVTEQQLQNRDKMAAGNGTSGAFTGKKSLGSILNLELIRDKTADQISELWMKFYASKDTVSAVIPGPTYEVISARARSCPMFLFALPRTDAYEFFVARWSAHRLHFTSLVNVQTRGEGAPSQMILHHFPDLKEDKDIVLVAAELDRESITVSQAQCLANQVQLFYATKSRETFGLVETFNRRPAHFQHMAVIAQLEQSGIA